MSSAANPEPVPPPKDLKTRKPCSPSQLAAILRNLSSVVAINSCVSEHQLYTELMIVPGRVKIF